jgi:hypothetical protein
MGERIYVNILNMRFEKFFQLRQLTMVSIRVLCRFGCDTPLLAFFLHTVIL